MPPTQPGSRILNSLKHMYKVLALVVLSLFVCHAISALECRDPMLRLERLPCLDDVLPGSPSICGLTMAGSGQMWPSYETVIDGVSFVIGFDGDHRVRFVATTDPAFAGVDALRIGDSPDAELRAAASESMVHEPGWGYYVRLRSGWNAFIDDSTAGAENLGTRPLGPDARVTMFFLRH